VLLFTVVVLTVIPVPLKLTVASFAKFVPVRIKLAVVPRIPLVGETLLSVGATTTVEYVAV
jgi:hypothetical protein